MLETVLTALGRLKEYNMTYTEIMSIPLSELSVILKVDRRIEERKSEQQKNAEALANLRKNSSF